MIFATTSVLGLMLCSLSFTTTDAQSTFVSHFCGTKSNFTANSTYDTKLNSLLSFDFQDVAERFFYNGSFAADDPSNQAYVLSICRPDVSLADCQSCADAAKLDLRQRCPVQKEAVIWYEVCMLRYANRGILSYMEVSPMVYVCDERENVADQNGLNQLLNDTMYGVAARAAAYNASSNERYAANEVIYSKSQTVYSLLQCTPDIISDDCYGCLQTTIAGLPTYCGGKSGGWGLSPSCNLRYELYPFYNSTASAPEGGNGRKALPIAAIVSVSAVVVVVVSASYIMYKRRSRVPDQGGNFFDDYSNENLERDMHVESQELPLMRLDLIIAATQHFSDQNKLGQGGFGPVYKGTLATGKEIAVKRLSRTSGQGLREFKNEVILIAKLQHRNLVRLLGCCLEGNESLLIYEYMPNKSLDFFIFDSSRGAQLDWKQRLVIINGIARGVEYLHEDSRLRIIHRDLKAGNVLLDHQMNPKISDFGMARIFGQNQIEANTNRRVGTYGYMAPEYAMEGLFSAKSDVYSFGVLLLEIISGKKNGGFYISGYAQSLSTFAWKLWCDGRGLELMDSILEESSVSIEVLKCVQIGLLCVQEDPADRPTMSSVVFMLRSDNALTLPQPKQPAFFFGRPVARPAQFVSNGKPSSVNEVTISNISPR